MVTGGRAKQTERDCAILIGMPRATHALLLFSLLAAEALAQQPAMATYKHPSGVFFQYPGNWQISEAQQALALLPPDLAKDEQGQPAEILLLSAEDADGITSATDPRVAAFFEQQVRQKFPNAKRVGEPETVRTGLGAGVILTFEGTGDGGVELRHRVYAAIHEETGIFLAHMSRKDIAARRDNDAKTIFISLGAGPAQVDPALAHLWLRKEYYFSPSSGLPGGASGSSTTYIYWQFDQEGNVMYASRSHLFMNTDSLSAIGQGDSAGDVWKGKYSTKDGVLQVAWSNGDQETYNYRVFTDGGLPKLKLQQPNAKKTQYFDLKQ